MKKESEIEVTKKEKQIEYFCDLCGNKYSFMYTQRSCSVCGRDVCSSCSILTDDMTEEEVCTDYPSRICNHCWNDLKEFRTELTELLDDFESKKIALYAKWKEESLEVNSDGYHNWRPRSKLCTNLIN